MPGVTGWRPPPLPVPPTGTAQPTFVGRAAETAAVEHAWAAVRAGARQVLLVAGEPGAGKSRLTREVVTALHRRGVVALLGACSPEPGPPYQPFVQCLEQLLGGTDAGELAEHLPAAAGELLRLSPLVARHRSDLAPPAADDAEQRRRLFDAYTGLLRSVSRVHPVVVVLEDLHWAGAPTRQLLSHLVQESADARLLLIGTYRTTEPDRSEELALAIADLYRLDGVRRLDLAGLSTDEVAQYLVMEGGLPPRRAREHAAVLRDHTGGNPFFLREVLRDLDVRDAPMPFRPPAPRAPATVRDTLRRRLTRLPEADRDVLETAAVLGDGSEVRTVVEVCGRDAEDVLPALDAAARFGLLDADALTGGHLAFQHMLSRQAVLDLLEPSRRVLLHARVGEVLEEHGSRTPHLAQQLAHHFSGAAALGYADRAAHYLVASAREAERGLAFEDAAGWYARAAELTDVDGPGRDDLWFAAARNRLRAGDFAAARDVYRDLSRSPDPDVRLRAAVGFEDAAWRPGLPGGDARRLLSRALDSTDREETDPLVVWALASLGRATAFTGDSQQARAAGERALYLAREVGDEPLLTHALETMMWHPVTPAVEEQLHQAEELTMLARATRNWEALGTAAVFRSAIAYLRSDVEGWDLALTDLERAVQGSGQPFLAYMRGCSDYGRAFLVGDFDAAERAAEDLLELGRSFGPDDTEGPYGLQMFMVRRERGGLDAVRPLVEATAGSETDAWEPGLLALYTELGLTEPARALLARLLDPLDDEYAQQPPWAQRSAVLVFLVEAALALRDTAAAARLRPLLAEHSGQQLVAGQFVALFGPADAYLAAVDALLGDTASAERLFEDAVAQTLAVGSVVHRATTLAAWAAHLAARPDPASRARAQDLRREARRLAQATGQVRVLRRLDQSGGAGPAGLTARELQVLHLLTQGSSNRAIARRLRITENTAAHHVRSILVKTGAANRTQVAMMAVAQHWVDGVPTGP